MTRSPAGSDTGYGEPERPATSEPTMLKALLRERHLQNYGLFKRAYQKAAKSLDKDLVETYPSMQTFRRWLAGKVKNLPYTEHCTVLEAMLPGWRAADLFKPYVAPDGVDGSTLLQELLHRRYIHDYRAFCRVYDNTAATIDRDLVGTYPAEQVFHRWISGDMIGLPYPDHCNVLEAMFPGYSARQLFEAATSPGPESPEGSGETPTKNGVPEVPGGAVPTVPGEVSAWEAVIGLQLPDQIAVSLVKHLESLASSLVTPQERDRAYHELVQLLRRWAHTMNRRDVLRTLGWAATAASLGDLLDPDERERVGSVLNTPSRIDTQTIEHFETILRHCKNQDDTIGPRGVLDTVLAQRNLIRSLLPDCPTSLRPQLISVLGNASRHAGWLSFNLNEFTSAAHYYEDARALAHEAQNIELGAVVLSVMSLLAVWQDKPRIGIDHAIAAEQWANRTDDMRLRAHCAAKVAKAYAADGQRDACLTAMDMATIALGGIGDQVPGYIYIYGEGLHLSNYSECYLSLRDADRAVDYAQKSLTTLNPSYTRIVALTTVDLGRAYAQAGEVDEAARLLGSAGELAARNSSARLIETIRRGRAELQPWQGTSAVRDLDDRLTTYGVT